MSQVGTKASSLFCFFFLMVLINIAKINKISTLLRAPEILFKLYNTQAFPLVLHGNFILLS